MKSLPADLSLPFFAYGTLKSSELAHRQISSFVHSTRPATLENFELAVIDGLPRAIASPKEQVIGEILDLDPIAYEVIAQYEQTPKVYEWTVGLTQEGPANLVCHVGDIKTRHDRVDSWRASDDTLLAHGMVWAIREVATATSYILKNRAFSSLVSDEGKFVFVRLQAAYGILWSIFERLTLFCEGPILNNEKMISRILQLKKIESWSAAVMKAQINHELGVRSSSNPQDRVTRTGQFGFEAWYKIRNNVVHRGKSAGKEFTQLKVAASDMCRTLAIFLQDQSVPVRDFLEKHLTETEKNFILIGFTQTELGRWEKENATRSNGLPNI
jgi:gamma-glutamylcyclotransferase (GGCT)/AIG2-like uncharacterized protein YtfP